MSETEEVGGKKKGKLGLSQPGRLELKKTVDAGQVRQNFSHGRSKAVTVEVRRRRTFRQDSAGVMKEVQSRAREEAEDAISVEEVKPVETVDVAAEEAAARAEVLRNLTGEERAARARALSGAQKAATEDAAERERAEREFEAEELVRKDEEARLAAEEAATKAAQAAVAAVEAAVAAEGPVRQSPAPAKTGAAAPVPAGPEDEGRDRPRRPGKGDTKRLTPRRGDQRRRGGKLTIAQALDDEERTRSLASIRRSRERERRALQQRDESVKIVRDVVVPESITVQELAIRMAERGSDVIKALMRMDVMTTMTQSIDADTAELVVNEFGHRIKRVSESDVEIGFIGDDDDMAGSLQPRAPIVTVMGHVDHGKTSLLDALRATDVVAGEAGGITQHIGAYQVRMASGQKITFLDTPGHEAFTAMRARGANVTDLVVLVVAADDGIMPQTVEAIDHAKAAGVPIIVAINKMDRPDADSTRVRNELLQHELVVEELGGDLLAVEVSATEKLNLDKLEEAILLQAELLELKANPDRTADGVVVEARLEKGRGAVSTMLVQRGTLKLGDIVVAGPEWGRVRALVSDAGEMLKQAGPAVPVEVLGMGGAPAAGDTFAVVESESRARELTEFRERQARDERTTVTAPSSLEQMFSNIEGGESSQLPVVIKADVQGSVEAIRASAEKMGTDEVAVQILHSGVGGINESDITLAKASNALVVGFNVRANAQARNLAAAEKVDIRYYSIIYQLIDDIKGMLSGMLKPTQRENFLGYATIQEVFNITKVGKIAGCRVTDGVVKRGSHVRLLRDDVVIHEGRLGTLKRFKEEVREVREGFECGLALEGYQDIKNNDVIECFDVEEVARTL